MLLAPFGLGGHSSAQAMTCSSDIDLACGVVFGVLGTVCYGTPPKLPPLPITTTNMAVRPITCPPMG
jgi:hypothetical protein